MHLLHGALEDPAAAAGKKGVADEREPGAHKGHVTGGVAWHVDDLELEVEFRQRDGIAAADRPADAVNRLVGRAEDRDRVACEQFFDAADVVAVMVGEEHRHEIQVPGLDFREDGAGFPRVDHGDIRAGG